MSQELAKFAFRLQKTFAPTVHVVVPKALLASIVVQLVKERRDEAAVCRELFRQGVWAGSLAVTQLASPAHLKRFWPGRNDPSGVASYASMIGEAFWLIFVGHKPHVRAAVLDSRGLVWVEVEEASDSDAFYKIETPAEVNTLFFVAGMFEGAFQTALRLVEAEGEWVSMWRPLNRCGVCGFVAHRSLPPSEAGSVIESRQPSFFRVIDWGQSVALFGAPEA